MSEKTIQVDLPILLPDIQDARDNCLAMLTHMLENQRGIKQVHITHEKTPTQLCLHYDPNLISLSAVERMVWDAGGQFKDRYRHEAIDVIGMHTADAATGLAEILSNLPGMLHVTVSYTARTAFVAYESDILQPNTIYQAIGQVGYKASMPQGADKKRKGRETNKEHEEHDHGSAPSFLPHLLQERWELFLVALAGVFILVGWVGETLFDLPEAIVLF
ncbi:MAG: heavy-metal-associated domain-containing protein, partial [Anaerolineales bacterium]|nr:heavy-metal-associated domain-containing protein [Anaerolineales bacterium]